MEHTGIYNAHLLAYLYQLHFPIWLENSLQIKRAGGLQRGKSDTIDAVRIAEYAFRFKDKTRLWQPPRQVIQQLAALRSVRHRLLVARQQLQQPLQEQQEAACAELCPPFESKRGGPCREIQGYYLRKVAEGKNKMSVLNAFRNNETAHAAHSSHLLGGASPAKI